jgi:hypothetical protein
MLTTKAIIKVAKDQVSADLKDEVVILNLKNQEYCGLNPVGARIWQLIQEPTTVAAVRDKILEEYEVDADRCERDLLAVLEELRGQGLIEVTEV